jgi:hypothetical protein
VYLLRTGRLDLAREFQGLPGWDVPYEVLTVLLGCVRRDLTPSHRLQPSSLLIDVGGVPLGDPVSCGR